MKKLLLILNLAILSSQAFSAEKAEKAEPETKVEMEAAPTTQELEVDTCGTHANDGNKYNQRQGVTVRVGPPGVQFGHSNPVGLPPGLGDLSVTYVWKCGYELNTEVVPGPTFGIRYRGGEFWYGSYGGGILVTANGIGPGVYAAVGVSLARSWPVTMEFEFKQGLGISVDSPKTHIITPYAFRTGASYWW